MTSSTRARRTRAAVLATAGALVVTLVPAVQSASAVGATPPPQFTYRSGTGAADVRLYSNVPDGTAGSITPITNAGYQVYSYDVSGDGRTTVACMSQGAATDDSYDRTYALLLTHRVNGITKSYVLSTFCESNPVIRNATSTAAEVFWYADDTIYKFTAAFDAVTAEITGSAAIVSTGQFVAAKSSTDGLPIEYATGLAVSDDGLNAAMMFRSQGAVASRLCLNTLAANAAPSPQPTTAAAANLLCPARARYAPLATATTKYIAVPNLLAFADGSSTVAYSLVDQVGGNSLGASLTLAGAILNRHALDNVYSLRKLDGAWWAWRDNAGTSEFGEATLGADPATWTAPAAWTPRADGATTYDYIPTNAAPPAYVAPDVKAAPHLNFIMSAAIVAYRAKPAYQTYNLYLKDPTDATYAAANAAEVDKGNLAFSYTAAAPWTMSTVTSGKNVFAIGSKWYNGYVPTGLWRNTYFRWTYAGDDFTEAGVAPIRVVKVAPTVTVYKALSGSYTTVYGKATRVLGTAWLQRYTSTGWRQVASTSITSVGTWSFGRRLLSRGTYRVLTVSDSSWAVGVRTFVR